MRRLGKLWWHHNGGRFWLHFGESGHVWSVEVSHGRLSPTLNFRWGQEVSEGAIQFHFTLWLNVFLTWELPWKLVRRLRFPAYERRFGVRWFMGQLQIELFSDNWGRDIGMTHNEHRWALWNNEWVTGRWRHERRVIATTFGTVVVAEDEQYPVKVTIAETRWRNRFREKRALSAWMDLIHEPGDPFPDTNYKWGDRDGIFGCGLDITTTGDVDAALESYAERVRATRVRYGYQHQSVS